jgi:hypothetical protein
MKKQTAVEWLQEAMSNKLSSEIGPYFLDLFEQAQEIEKEQIIEAYRDGRTDQQTRVPKFYNRSSAIYYTSTYGS